MDSDPRMQGFNYSKGWGSAPKPPIYQIAMQITRRVSQEANRLSSEAWALEMALWRVRIASNGVEKAQAMAALSASLARYLPLAAE